MKRMIIKNDEALGRKTEVNAQKTYMTRSGKWVAEVNGPELQEACDVLCNGIDNCSCENMHGEADLDDDGKEYRLERI
jgi:hypothetical protein